VKKGGIPFFSLFFLSYNMMTYLFSQENILKKSMSSFGGTEHGKISTQKKFISTCDLLV
jgi:hypothetical protein